MDKTEKKITRGRKPTNNGEIIPGPKTKAAKNKNMRDIFENRCHVCLSEFIKSKNNADLKGNTKITCVKCGLDVHLGCYGLTTMFKHGDRNEFLCDFCLDKRESKLLDCFICGNSDSFVRAFKRVKYKNTDRYIHVLCGLFARNIRVVNWGLLQMEYSPSDSVSEEKSQCKVCLHYSHRSDVWKCFCCDKQAHFICMLIDKVLQQAAVTSPEENTPTWEPLLFISQNYPHMIPLDQQIQSQILNKLREYASHKSFAGLQSHKKHDKAFLEGFVDKEVDCLGSELSKLERANPKMGEIRESTNIWACVFCPAHFYPNCCFANAENSKKLVCCDHCDSWMHEECLKNKDVSLINQFYCENCEEWFSKRKVLEDICNICPKSEYQTPQKTVPSPPKLEENPLQIKREPFQSQEKPALFAIAEEEICLAEGLIEKLPVQGSKLPIRDMIQLMFFLDSILGNLLNRWETIDRKQVLGVVQILATIPFKSAILMDRVLSKWLTELFLDREIIAKTLSTPLSIYGQDNNLIEENMEANKEKLHEIQILLRIEGNDSEEGLDKAGGLLIPKEKKEKIQKFKEMIETLISAQSLLINSIFGVKRIPFSDLRDLLARSSSHPALAETPEFRILSTNYSQFELITQEISLKLSQKAEETSKEKDELEAFLGQNREISPEKVIHYCVDRRKALLLENIPEIQAGCLMTQAMQLGIEYEKSAALLALEKQLGQLKIINGIISNVGAASPEAFESLFAQSAGFIINSLEIPRFLDFYREFRLWKNRLNVFQAIRKSQKISGFILQDKAKRIAIPNCTVFSYLSNNVAIETSPKVSIGNCQYSVYEVLSLENLAQLIKEGKTLLFINIIETLFELETLLKKSYLFQQTLRYIYESGLPKEGETPLEIEFSLEEIFAQMEEFNLFLPVFYDFDALRKRFSAVRTIYSINPEFRFVPMPYSSFEEDFMEKYKEKVLHEVYRFREEGIASKESIKQLAEYFGYFEKDAFREKYSFEFKVLSDIYQHYRFLGTLVAFSAQYRKSRACSMGPVRLSTPGKEEVSVKFMEFEGLEEICGECERFLDELMRDFRNETGEIEYDWEKNLGGCFEKEVVVYEKRHLPGLIARFKLFLWLKQIHAFLSEPSKEYSRYYYLNLKLNDLISQHNQRENLQNKEVLYEQFLAFSSQVQALLEEISKKIQERLRLKTPIEENALGEVELELAKIKEKLRSLGLVYPMAQTLLSDFEYCCVAARKSSVLYSMIAKDNKKIEYNAMKILVEFASKFEFCELFPSFLNLRLIYNYYEGLIGRVASLKDAFGNKKQALMEFKVSNIRIMQEKFICSRVTYSKAIYTAVESLMTYDQTKLLMDELNSMKINIKTQRDVLSRYKSKTEVFARSCEKLYHERRLQSLLESNSMENLTSLVLLRNELITGDVLAGTFVNEFRCYDWSLIVLMIQKGFIVFLSEFGGTTKAIEKFNRRFHKKKSPLFKVILNSEGLFRDLYYEGRAAQKVFEKTRFANIYQSVILDMSLTLETVERLKTQASGLRLKKAQLLAEEEASRGLFEKDKDSRSTLKTKRVVYPVIRDLEQNIKDMVETRINLDEEYTLFSGLKTAASDFQREVLLTKNLVKRGQTVREVHIRQLFSKVLTSPINLEESEEFVFLLTRISLYFREKLGEFNRKAMNQGERLDFIKELVSQSERFAITSDFIENMSKTVQLIRSLEGVKRKRGEGNEDVGKTIEKSCKFLKKARKEKDWKQSPNLAFTFIMALLKTLLQLFEQETPHFMLKFSTVQQIYQEIRLFWEDAGEDVRTQPDFIDFSQYFGMIQGILQDIGNEMKRRAFKVKNQGSDAGVRIGEGNYRGVEINEELRRVLLLGEEEFIGYFSQYESLLTIKTEEALLKDRLKMEGFEEKVKAEESIENPFLMKGENCWEESERLMEEFMRFFPKEGSLALEDDDLNDFENGESDNSEDMEIESDDEREDEDDEDEDEDDDRDDLELEEEERPFGSVGRKN